MATSIALNETLLYGGAGINGIVDSDTWVYANGNWTNLTPLLPGAPGPLAGEMVAYDVADGYFLLFGGITAYGGTVGSHTWQFNGSWHDITGTVGTPPSPRFGSAMAYDAAAGAVAMYGGWSNTATLSDTWTFAHGVWTNVSGTAGTPPIARGFAGSTYDERAHAFIVWGGATVGSQTFYNDTWELTLAGGDLQWKNITGPGGIAPPALRMSTLAFDPSYGYDLLVGGDGPCAGCAAWENYRDVWTLDNGTWTNVTQAIPSEPPGRFDATMFYDPTVAALVLFGGCILVGCVAGLNDTWRWTWNVSASVGESSYLIPANSTLTLAASATGGTWNNYTYAWSGLPPGCISANLPALSCDPSMQGNYTPSVTVTDRYVSSYGGASSTAVGAPIRVTPPVALSFAGSRLTVDAFTAAWINTTVSGGVGGYTFLFSGLPPGCVSANLSHLFCLTGSSGSWTVGVMVVDANQDPSSTTVTVTVYPAFGLYGTSSADIVDIGQSVDFLATATGGAGGPVTYVWTAPGGGCGSLVGPIIYCDPPDQTNLDVAVVAYDSFGGRGTFAFGAVEVLPLPSVTIEATALSGVAPFAVSFNATVVGGASPYVYHWEFGDGTSAGTQVGSHTYLTAGTYLATVWVNDSLGAGTSAKVVLTVASGGHGTTPTKNATGSAVPWELIAIVAIAVAIAAVALAVLSRTRGPRPPAAK